MDIKPELYSKINSFQRQTAQNIAKEILEDGLLKKATNVCVDVGCGNGEVTQIIASSIPSAQVYAFDIDGAMVEYAAKSLTCVGNKNLSLGSDKDDSKKINYFKDDISNCWEGLTEQLRSLEGKVDIIWSNFVLHWIPQKYQQRAAFNILRLLKPGGKIYLNVILLRPIPVLTGNQYIRDVLIVPSMNKQATVWLQYFKLEPFELSSLDGNIAILEWSENVARNRHGDNFDYILGGLRALIENFLLQNYKNYFLCNMTDEEKEAAFAECSTSLIDQHISVTEGTHETVIVTRSDVLEIRAIKSI